MAAQIVLFSLDPSAIRMAPGPQSVLLAELGGGRVIGIEIKASAAPSADDAKHLIWLRDQLEERFLAGIVFHTGPAVFAPDRGILAVPIATLWS